MKKCLSLFLIFLFSFSAFAQSGFNPQDLLKPVTGKQQLVNDYTGTLTADQKQALENKLVQFDDSTSTQVVVLIIPNLGNYEIADYSVKLGRAWGVGGKEFNNGVILLISKDDRKLNIATGYGVEGALPDVTCKHIIDEVIVPNFKGNDYYRGIDGGTDAIIKATRGEYKAPENYHPSRQSFGLIKIIFFIMIVVVILALRGGGGGGGSFFSNGGAFLLGNLLGGGGRGGGGFSGGGDSNGGGGSSGGFGGFGGGSFGGGGSSGSW